MGNKSEILDDQLILKIILIIMVEVSCATVLMKWMTLDLKDWVNIGLENDLVSSGNKSLTEPMVT